jgi:hypothetical protein
VINTTAATANSERFIDIPPWSVGRTAGALAATARTMAIGRTTDKIQQISRVVDADQGLG